MKEGELEVSAREKPIVCERRHTAVRMRRAGQSSRRSPSIAQKSAKRGLSTRPRAWPAAWGSKVVLWGPPLALLPPPSIAACPRERGRGVGTPLVHPSGCCHPSFGFVSPLCSAPVVCARVLSYHLSC